MQSGVGLQGRVDISIKKADGRVLKQRIYNDLSGTIHRELADKIAGVANAYHSDAKPEKIKIFAKGYGGVDTATPDTEFETNALATYNFDADSDILPLVKVTGDTVELKYAVADFLFNANVDDFGVGDRFEADGVNTRINKVWLLAANGTTVLGVARAANESTESDRGHGDLTEDVGGTNYIDDNDKVTVTYTITFSSSASALTGTDWLEVLAATVKDGPAGGVVSPDPSIKSMKLRHLNASGGVETITQPDVTANVSHLDHGSTTTYVYIGDPDIQDLPGGVADIAGTPTDPVEFPDVSSPEAPTEVEVLGVNGTLIGKHTITSGSEGTDIPDWDNGDNVKVHYIIIVKTPEGFVD